MTDVQGDQSISERQVGSAWFAFAEKLLSLGYDIFQEAMDAGIPVTEKQFAEPDILAVALLCRTISNFKGVIALAKLGLVVEARTLTRCCYENLFLIGGLVEKGAAFVSAMYHDDLKSTILRGSFALEIQKQPDNCNELFGKLEARLKEMKTRWPNAKFLKPKDAAKSSVLSGAYLFYSQLSADAAHPSLQALKRHMVRDEEDGEQLLRLDVTPVNKGTELTETVDLACNALIGACVGTNQILGGTALNQKIAAPFDEYGILSKAMPNTKP
jgi:hypothetical protein